MHLRMPIRHTGFLINFAFSQLTQMSLIPKPIKSAPKPTLSIRLRPEIKQQLGHYCALFNYGPQHVVEQALIYLFERDEEFQARTAGVDMPAGRAERAG